MIFYLFRAVPSDEAIHKAFAPACLYLLNLFNEDTAGWANYNVMVARKCAVCAERFVEEEHTYTRIPDDGWICLIVTFVIIFFAFWLKRKFAKFIVSIFFNVEYVDISLNFK